MKWFSILGLLLAGALLLPQQAWAQGAVVNNGLELQGSTLSDLYIKFKLGTNTGTLQPAGVSTNPTWTLPDASGEIITSGNINATTLSYTGGQLTANNTSAIWNADQLQGNAVAPGTLGAGDAGKVLLWTGSQWAATALSGDIASVSGTGVVELSNTGVTAGTYGSATEVAQITVDAKGRITSVTNVPISVSPGGPAGGDLDGNYPNPTVDGLCGTPLNCTAIGGLTGTDRKVLTWNGTNWVPWGIVGDGTTTTVTAGMGNFTISANNTSAIWNADQLQGNAVAPGTLGAGDAGKVLLWTGSQWAATGLSGDIASVSGAGVVELSNTGVSAGTYGSATQVAQITVDAKGRITSATNVTISGVSPGGPAGGDLSGTYPNPTVAKIQGNPVASGTLGTGDAGKVLQWNGSQWIAAGVSAAGGWAVGGNDLGGGSTGVLGTTSNDNLEIRTNNNLAMFISASNQYVGVGTNDPQSRLHVHGSEIRVTNSSTGSTATDGFVVGLSSSDAELRQYENARILFNTNAAASGDTVEAQLTSTGQLVFFTTGTPGFRIDLPNNSASAVGRIRAVGISFWSSMRWKEDIRPIGNALEKVLALRGVNFRWKPEYGGGEDMGFIMEEVDRVVPEVVQRDERTGELLGMDYARLTALLVEALKEEHRRNESLRAELAELRALVEQLLRQNGERGAGS